MTDLRRLGAFFLLAGYLVLPGCTAMPLTHRLEPARPGVQTPPPKFTNAKLKGSSRDILDSVEAFLERTRDYQSPGAQNTTRASHLNNPSVSQSSGQSAYDSTSRPMNNSGLRTNTNSPYRPLTGSSPSIYNQSQPRNRQSVPLQPPRLTTYTPGSGPARTTTANARPIRSIPPSQQAWTPPTQNSFNPYNRTANNSSIPTIPTQTPNQALPVIEAIHVRPVTTQPAIHHPVVNVTTPNQPPPIQSLPVTGPALVDQFLTFLRSVAETNVNFENEWRYRMANLALNRDADATAISPSLPEDTRALLLMLIRAAQGVRRVARNPLRMDSEALNQVNDLRGALLDQSDLLVSTVAFCQKVITYGAYEEMSPTAFVAGTPTQTIVYSEIDNFQSEQTADNRYLTQLGTRLEILSPTGESLWYHEEPEIVDECRRRRNDFFIAQRVTIPGTIPAGDYVLKVRVEDRLSGRISEGTATFTIHSALTRMRTP